MNILTFKNVFIKMIIIKYEWTIINTYGYIFVLLISVYLQVFFFFNFLLLHIHLSIRSILKDDNYGSKLINQMSHSNQKKPNSPTKDLEKKKYLFITILLSNFDTNELLCIKY